MAYLAHASQFTGELVAYILLGLWIDHVAGTSPWVLVGGCVVGGAASLYHLIRNVTVSPRQGDLPPKQQRDDS
ncbi:Putative F0F1-ATPase subunit [Planctomycetes bacterium Pan216]|uniref:F0F1-ATPase subunit n=1 Tax=Kolteria novifilia TaxID=2527975 RepID=A0A518B8G3_9BACT|nr:Putative F0F1-ATPase subunit [Planctomycetes bacterium Pan216]